MSTTATPDPTTNGDAGIYRAILGTYGEIGTSAGTGRLTLREPQELATDWLVSGQRWQMITNLLLDDRVYSAHVDRRLPLLQAEWSLSITPEEDPEIAAEMHEAFFERLDWMEFLHDITLFMRYGCMLMEITYVPPDPVTGRVYIDSIEPRMPWTLDTKEPFVRRGRELVAFRQIVQDPTRRRAGERTVDIPAEKCLMFVHERLGSDLFGQPLSRFMSKAAQIKDVIEHADAVAASRTGSGVPVMKLRRADIKDTERLDYAKRVVKGVKVNEEEGVVEIGDEAEFRLEGVRGSVHPNEKSMRYHREAIGNAAGMGTGDLGKTQSGSRALAEPLLDKEQLLLLHGAAYLCKEVDKAGERWVRINYGDVPRERIPKFQCRLRETRNQIDYVNALGVAKGNGMFGPWGIDDVNQVRREFRHNELTPEEMAAYEEEKAALTAQLTQSRPPGADDEEDDDGAEG